MINRIGDSPRSQEEGLCSHRNKANNINQKQFKSLMFRFSYLPPRVGQGITEGFDVLYESDLQKQGGSLVKFLVAV